MRVDVCAGCGVSGVTWFDPPSCVACSAKPAPVVAEWVRAIRADHAAGMRYADIAVKHGQPLWRVEEAVLNRAYRGAA